MCINNGRITKGENVERFNRFAYINAIRNYFLPFYMEIQFDGCINTIIWRISLLVIYLCWQILYKQAGLLFT